MSFLECAGIKVMPGGKLNVNSSALKGCDHARWEGITVLGNPHSPQISVDQGIGSVSGSTIEDADIGILAGYHLGQTFDNSVAGGIINTSNNTVMQNNSIDIMFLPYGQFRSSSVIEQTTFGPLYPGNQDCAVGQTKEHINVGPITGLTIRDNIFEQGLGVSLNGNSDFSITGNVFNGTETGIQTTSSSQGSMASIERNNFFNNEIAISFSNDNHSRLNIVCNNFDNYAQYAIYSVNTILKDQGTKPKGAGNRFSSLSEMMNHPLHHSGNPMTYFFDPSNPISLQIAGGLTAVASKANSNNSCQVQQFKTDSEEKAKQNSKEIAESALLDNIPNPFNQTTTIRYTLASDVGKVEIKIFNLLGLLVEKHTVAPNSNSLEIDCSQYAGGMYFYSLLANDKLVGIKKMTVIK